MTDPPIEDLSNFVIVNSQLNDEFDQFKGSEVKQSYSLLPLIELLTYFCLLYSSDLRSYSEVTKFGRKYLELSSSEIDILISWVYETRRQLEAKGKDIFITALLKDMLGNFA